MVAHRELAINLIVRSHNGPRVTLADGNLKATQVYLTCCTLADTFVDAGTIGLLRVDGKVLGRYANALLLHTLNIGSSNLTRQQGIFRIVLEITTTEGIAMQVHARTQNDVATVFLGLITNSLTDFTNQFCVPSGSQTRTNRESSSIIGFVSTFASGVDTYTGRAVRQYGSRNSQTGNSRRGTSSTCNQIGLATDYCASIKEIVSTSHKKFRLLFQGHGLYHIIDIIGLQFNLSIHCCHCQHCQ